MPSRPEQEQRHRGLLEHGLQQPPLGVRAVGRRPRRGRRRGRRAGQRLAPPRQARPAPRRAAARARRPGSAAACRSASLLAFSRAASPAASPEGLRTVPCAGQALLSSRARRRPRESMILVATSVTFMFRACETCRIRCSASSARAAERVHQHALGLVHHGAGLGGVTKLPGGAPGLAILGGDADHRPAEGDQALGHRDRIRAQRPAAARRTATGTTASPPDRWARLSEHRTPWRSAALAYSGHRRSSSVSAQPAGSSRTERVEQRAAPAAHLHVDQLGQGRMARGDRHGLAARARSTAAAPEQPGTCRAAWATSWFSDLGADVSAVPSRPVASRVRSGAGRGVPSNRARAPRPRIVALLPFQGVTSATAGTADPWPIR